MRQPWQKRCNDLGYRTKRGNLFERRTVDRIFENPFYCGTVIWNGVELKVLTKLYAYPESVLRKGRN